MSYGITALGLPIPLNEEKTIVVKEHISITSADSYFGWYPLPNIPADTDINDIYVFSNNCYVTYEPIQGYGFSIDFNISLPTVRRNKSGYEIFIGFPHATKEHVFTYDIVATRDDVNGNPPPPYVLWGRPNHMGSVLVERYPIKEVNINLKIAVAVAKLPLTNLPKYGIVVFDKQGDLTYNSNDKAFVKFKRRIVVTERDIEAPERQYNPFAKFPASDVSRLNKGEYILMNTVISFYDEISLRPSITFNDRRYSSGYYSPAIRHGEIIIDRFSLFVVPFEEHTKWNKPSYVVEDELFFRNQIFNPIITVASIPD